MFEKSCWRKTSALKVGLSFGALIAAGARLFQAVQSEESIGRDAVSAIASLLGAMTGGAIISAILLVLSFALRNGLVRILHNGDSAISVSDGRWSAGELLVSGFTSGLLLAAILMPIFALGAGIGLARAVLELAGPALLGALLAALYVLAAGFLRNKLTN